MSELKSYNLVDIQDYRGEVYLKSEADAYHKKILDAGCVPAEELNAYQGPQKRLCGWGVEKTVKFDRRLTLLDFGINTPPQSWCYTGYEIIALEQGRTAK